MLTAVITFALTVLWILLAGLFLFVDMAKNLRNALHHRGPQPRSILWAGL